MILYTLRCGDDHRFEAWFRNGGVYDAQKAAGLLSCPLCGRDDVTKALMTPSVHGGRERDSQVGMTAETDAALESNAIGVTGSDAGSATGSAVPAPAAPSATDGDGPIPMATGPIAPDSPRAALVKIAMAQAMMVSAARRLRRRVEQTHEHVGPRFAEEVRAMHRGEIDHRLVYGDATLEQAEDLRDEGIDVAAIPWVTQEDA